MLQTIAYFSRPMAFLQACHRRYGDRFTISLIGMGHLVYLVDPDDVRTVFRGDPAVLRAGEANAPLAGVLGPRSVIVVDGPPHTDARRLMTPAFRGPALAELLPTMTAVAEAEVATWPASGTVVTLPRMKAVALEIILRTVIGTSDPVRLAELRRVLPPLVDLGGTATLALFEPRLERFWPWRRRRAIRAEADRVLYEEIAHTRREPERPGVLATMAAATDDDDELRDQLVTLLLAGHETTATGLAWALERLVRDPEALARAREAADGEGPEADRHLDAVVTETLRVRPVVPDVVRRLAEPVTLGDAVLPAGAVVTPSVALIQRDPRRHADPEHFRPERHVRPDGTVHPDPLTWLPFGGGVRRCVGAAFATLEMRAVLRVVLRAVELEPTSAPSEPARARHVTLAPARGARVVVRAPRAPVADRRRSRT